MLNSVTPNGVGVSASRCSGRAAPFSSVLLVDETSKCPDTPHHGGPLGFLCQAQQIEKRMGSKHGICFLQEVSHNLGSRDFGVAPVVEVGLTHNQAALLQSIHNSRHRT